MIRYQIRNEYGVSDPALYAAPGEEDDPEALLEGVAMAGLVGVLRQLGDLAEFAAEIFHDLHEDVMATASRGHGLMLRLQQLEAEFPAAEKAIISQTDHSNYPHDEGVEWHPNLQFKQNMITQGDMPRFILDSYEECRGPPRLFTLDKFDVAGAGASLKRYSDPSFFKTEHASTMIESDVIMEKKPRRIKKKAMRWRKGVTLEALLVANSESQPTSKDRASRKVPPRTTKLKSRHPRSPDYKTISRICREHLQEVISSQQKIMSSCSARHYYGKFRSTDSSETTSPLGELSNFGALQSSGKLEQSKVVPINESDTVDATSAPTNASGYLEADDKRCLGKQHGLTEFKEVSNKSPVEQKGMICASEKLQDCPDLVVGENNQRLQSTHESRLRLAASHADQNADGCRSDNIASDDNFVDALNSMDTEGVINPEMKTRQDPTASVEGNELNLRSKEGENASDAKFVEVGPTVESSSGLNVSCNIEEPTSLDLPLISDSVPSTVVTTNGPNSGSPSGRQLNDVDWTNDGEPFNDEDLMDVSSSSSVVSDTADLQTIDDSVGHQQHQDGVYPSLDTAFVHSFDEQSPNTSRGLDGSSISSNSVNHGQNSLLDGSSMSTGGPNHVSEDEEEIINVGDADEIFVHPTKSDNELQESKKELEEGESVDTGTSLGTLAALPDKDHIMSTGMDMDNVGVPEESVVEPTSAGLDPDDIHGHLDGISSAHPNIHNNLLYESNDEETIEDVQSLPDDDLSVSFNKHDTEDQQVAVLDEGTCSARLGTQKEDSVQPSAVAKDFACAQELPGIIQGEPPLQDDMEVYEEEISTSSCVVNDDTEPLNTGPCVEHHELTEMEDALECGEITEESATSRFADGLVSPEEITEAAKISDKAEVLSTEENCRHDVQLQSSSPLTEELETGKATCGNLGALDESRDSKKSMLQTNNIPFNELETAGEKCSDNGDVHLPSSAHFPEESDCEQQLLEEASLNSEVLSGCNSSDKDGAVSLRNNAMERQPANADQDLVWGMATRDGNSCTVKKQPANANQDLSWNLSAQDSSSTNPFIDSAYLTSHAQIYPSTTSYQSCLSEEQDFLSEILVEHDNMGAASDSFWEPATPPDEAPLPSEVMTEEDFRSFCHEYHEINFTGGTDGCHGESASDSNNISDAVVVSESDWACSVPSQPVKLDQEAFIGSNFSSQHAEYSPATDAHADTSMPLSVKNDLEDEAPEVDSHLKSRDSFSDNRSPELNMFSVPVGLQQEQHMSGVDSRSSSCLFDKEKTNEERCSPSSDVAVKEELEDRASLVPHSFVNENVDKLDVPPTNAMPVELEAGAHVLDEHNNKDVSNFLSDEFDSPNDRTSSVDEDRDSPEASVLTSFQAEQPSSEHDSQIALSSSLNENIGELEGRPLCNAVVRDQETEVCVPRGLDSQIIPCSSADEKIYDCAPLSSSECFPSGEHDSQISLSSSLDEKIVEPEGHSMSCAVVLDQEPEVCVPHGLDSRIIPCSPTDEKIYGHDCAHLSSSVHVDLDSEDHALGDHDSQVKCSLVKDKIDESEAAQQNIILSEEHVQDARASPVLDSQFAPFSFNIDSVGEIDGPSPCSAQVESEKEQHLKNIDNAEFDSETAPCSSDALLADRTALTPITPGNAKTCPLSLDPPLTISFQNDSYEDPQKPPPLPPLQWRLGRPRLGLLNTQGCIPESARGADPILPASSQEIDTELELLDQTNRSLEPVPPEAIKDDTIKISMTDGNDRTVEFGRLLPSVTESGIARPLPEASENIKQHEHIPSSTIGLEEHPDDKTGIISKTGVEEHLDNSGITHGTDMYPTNSVLPFPTNEQQDRHLHILSSDTSEKSEHPRLTHPSASEDDRSVNDHNAAVDMVGTSKQGHIYESRCYQQAEHPESLSENLEHGGHISGASEDGNIVKYQYIRSEAPSDMTNLSAPDSLLEEENYQEGQTLQGQNSASSEDSQLRGSLPIAESMATQDCPNDRHNMERENINGQRGPDPAVSVLDEGSYVHAEQPPVMGWTVGPQMLHPNYGISMKERPFEPNITDNHLIRKPISIRNIPRNPLVDAVAAHDRNSMRKISELAPPTDKPNERNLLLEQIRNKTFNLKPASSPMPIAIRSPARVDARNLKVAAIIEKANAIRQAVGSDDEDGDNWSD